MGGTLRALVFALLTQNAGCQLHISIQPNKTDVDDVKDVTIRCSLNLRQTNTDRVYSIMLKRRGMTVAVLLTDGFELPDRQYIVDGTLSIAHPGSPYLQVTLSNVSCYDRGDYSCRMAVRRSYRNLQLGPVSSKFKVIGKPSAVVLEVKPRKAIYTVGEVVTFTCSALKKSASADWSWNLSSPLRESSESCSYSQSDCLYKCSSSVLHSITQEDAKLKSRCGYEQNFRSIQLSVTSFHVSDAQPKANSVIMETKQQSPETSQTPKPEIPTRATEAGLLSLYPSQSRASGGRGKAQKTILIYSFISVFCVLFLCLFIYMFVSDRYQSSNMCRKRRNNTDSEDGIQRRHYNKRRDTILVPYTPRVHVPADHRHSPSESDYLIPQSDVEAMNLRNEMQNSQSTEGNENIYEEVGRSHEHQIKNFTSFQPEYGTDLPNAHENSNVIYLHVSES